VCSSGAEGVLLQDRGCALPGQKVCFYRMAGAKGVFLQDEWYDFPGPLKNKEFSERVPCMWGKRCAFPGALKNKGFWIGPLWP